VKANSHKPFVLVHGAWHGGWCWQRVERLLRERGHRTLCPTLAGLGERAHLLDRSIDLETHIAEVCELITGEALSEVVLVGHSYGGFVIAGVADRLGADAIAAMVFLDAFVPHDQDSFIGSVTIPNFRQSLEEAIVGGEIAVAPLSAASLRVNERDRPWVDAMCTPHPLASMTQRIELGGARDRVRRKRYIRATGFRSSMFDDIYQRVGRETGWELHEIASGHDAMIDAPEALATLLLDVTE
jgi:pimeloyl-ACP methyl ester carboxylesterase